MPGKHRLGSVRLRVQVRERAEQRLTQLPADAYLVAGHPRRFIHGVRVQPLFVSVDRSKPRGRLGAAASHRPGDLRGQPRPAAVIRDRWRHAQVAWKRRPIRKPIAAAPSVDGVSAPRGRSGDFTRGRRLVRLLRSGVLLSSPRSARWEPPRWVPVSSRRGPGTFPRFRRPLAGLFAPADRRLGREERERQRERRPGRRVGGASGPSGPP